MLNVIYPATYDFIAKIATGLADNDLASLTFATTNAFIPTLIFPALHTCLYKSPFLLRNKNILEETNSLVHWYDPVFGELPDGSEGMGRIHEPQLAYDEIKRVVAIMREGR